MAKSEAQQLGYDFEDEVKDILRNIQTQHPVFWHRFPDAKAARGHLAAQPADFMVTSPAHGDIVLLLETKASLESPSLRACAKTMIDPQQRGMHRKWHRAKQESVFLFYCQIQNIVELWDGRCVIEALAKNEPLPDSARMEMWDYFELQDRLTSWLV